MGLKQKIFGSGGVKGQYNKMKKKAYGSKGVRGRYDPTRTGSLWATIDNLKKDFNTVKDRLNVEKNYKDQDLATHLVGQVNQNAEGSYCAEITPIIAQGDGKGQRIGNSLKMTGISIPIQFNGQQYCLNGRKIRFTLIRSRGKPRTANEVREDMYDVNPINGLVRDYNAPRKYTKGDGLQVIRSKSYYLKPPSLDNGAIGVDQSEASVLSVKFNVKLKDTWRYDGDTSSVPDNLRYFVLVQCDAGNISTTGSTIDVPVQSTSSGIQLRYAARFWYVDN